MPESNEEASVTVPDHAVLLAAGQGSRLRPLTDLVPKSLLPIDGRAVIDHVIDQLRSAGVDDMTVVVGHGRELLCDHLERCGMLPATSRIAIQHERHGSGHALQCARAHGMPSTDTVVSATDTVFPPGAVRRLMERFAAERPMIAMGVRQWPVEQLPHRSCLTVDAALRVTRVIEKPRPDEVTSAYSGAMLYVFREDFWPYVEALEPGPNGIVELAHALQQAIDDGHVVRGVDVGDTRDITRPADLLRENFPYLRPYLPAGPPAV